MNHGGLSFWRNNCNYIKSCLTSLSGWQCCTNIVSRLCLIRQKGYAILFEYQRNTTLYWRCLTIRDDRFISILSSKFSTHWWIVRKDWASDFWRTCRTWIHKKKKKIQMAIFRIIILDLLTCILNSFWLSSLREFYRSIVLCNKRWENSFR